MDFDHPVWKGFSSPTWRKKDLQNFARSLGIGAVSRSIRGMPRSSWSWRRAWRFSRGFLRIPQNISVCIEPDFRVEEDSERLTLSLKILGGAFSPRNHQFAMRTERGSPFEAPRSAQCGKGGHVKSSLHQRLSDRRDDFTQSERLSANVSREIQESQQDVLMPYCGLFTLEHRG